MLKFSTKLVLTFWHILRIHGKSKSASFYMRRETSTIKLRSNAQNIEQLEKVVHRVTEQLRLSPDMYGNMLVSLTEAVNNATIHGNRLDESKFVEINWNFNNGKVLFTVSDQGNGFDYQNIADPTQAENKCKCGGRGVLLMRTLADECAFRDNGRRVEMTFRVAAANR